MKPSVLCPSRRQTAVLAAAFGLTLLAAPAYAFTLEGGPVSSGNPNSSANFSSPSDPKARVDSLGGAGSTTSTFQSGNSTFYLGAPSSASNSSRFESDANRLFNPLGRPER